MYFQILIASRFYRIHQPNPTSLGKDQERAKVEMEKKHKEKVSQEGNNIACILVLPQHQRLLRIIGYSVIVIVLSYYYD